MLLYKTIGRIAGIAMIAGIGAAGIFAGEPADSGLVKNAAKTTFLLVGGAQRDMTRANRSLDNAGLPGLSKYAATLGFGHTTRMKRMISTGELIGTMSNRWELNNRESELSSVYLIGNMGFDLVQTPNFNLYPMAGIGGGILNYVVRTGKRSFTDYAAERENPVNLWQATFLVNAGLGTDVIFPAADRRAFTLGLRAGYLYDPMTRSSWRSDGAEITHGPRPDLSGPYVKLIIGHTGPVGWWHHGDKSCKGGKPGCEHAM